MNLCCVIRTYFARASPSLLQIVPPARVVIFLLLRISAGLRCVNFDFLFSPNGLMEDEKRGQRERAGPKVANLFRERGSAEE